MNVEARQVVGGAAVVLLAVVAWCGGKVAEPDTPAKGPVVARRDLKAFVTLDEAKDVRIVDGSLPEGKTAEDLRDKVDKMLLVNPVEEGDTVEDADLVGGHVLDGRVPLSVDIVKSPDVPAVGNSAVLVGSPKVQGIGAAASVDVRVLRVPADGSTYVLAVSTADLARIRGLLATGEFRLLRPPS